MNDKSYWFISYGWRRARNIDWIYAEAMTPQSPWEFLAQQVQGEYKYYIVYATPVTERDYDEYKDQLG